MKNKIKSLTIIINLSMLSLISEPFPIQFSISESKVVKDIPKKIKDFAYIVPGQVNTYIYQNETDYYKDYQESFFAITRKKAGWDCLRHYEILANGCIPYFIDLEKCPNNTMTFLPKKLILEAMNLEGVSKGKIDHRKFNKQKYNEILNKILSHTRKYLTTEKMAEYILTSVNYSGKGKILFLSDVRPPDYIVACTLIGLKELLKEKVIDFPKIDYIYKNYKGDTKQLYGKGFTYTKIVDDYQIDRTNIIQRIKNKEFEFIIYPAAHWNNNIHFKNTEYYFNKLKISHIFYDEIKENYPDEKIIYLDGEDIHTNCPFINHLKNFFLREF